MFYIFNRSAKALWSELYTYALDLGQQDFYSYTKERSLAIDVAYLEQTLDNSQFSF